MLAEEGDASEGRAAQSRVELGLHLRERPLVHLAAHLEAQRGHRLVEEPVPGAAAGDGLFMEELLDAVFELVGLVEPQVDHPGAVAAE